MTLRRRLWLTLDPTEKGGIAERIFEIILISTIILNIAEIILESVTEFHDNYLRWFRAFEQFSVVFFTVEYIARIYSIVEHPKHQHPVKGRIDFVTSPLAIIDLLAILPYYLTFLPLDLRFLRIFRLMALFRMFKLARYLKAIKVFQEVLNDRKEQLVLSIIFILFMLVVISSIMFYVEYETQPEVFSSIPAAMWWGVSTLTTVGYGDMVPVTPLGRTLGGLFSLMGVGLFALPAGILSSGFYERMHRREPVRKCPHCGKDIHD